MNQQPAVQNQAQAQAPNAAGQDDWDEARLEEAMKRLKLLHIKVRQLNDTIPKMIKPLVQKQPSRRAPWCTHTLKQTELTHHLCIADVMFAAFMNSVNEAQANIKEVTDLMRDEKSREIFTQAKKRKEEEPTGIKTWEYYDHPDWFRMDEE
ncbi:hypothetical protein FPHYL_10873 [Fusarium phyllophilum]|uniref:Uncharacterized protein n=1 Tax=Fusarium phyllophilum TaxID=47803 RepID=A0A8H5MXX6_9HYPO|nr:hypothetical protein FPHYL_10873 [Fusarium phyllophilum]